MRSVIEPHHSNYHSHTNRKIVHQFYNPIRFFYSPDQATNCILEAPRTDYHHHHHSRHPHIHIPVPSYVPHLVGIFLLGASIAFLAAFILPVVLKVLLSLLMIVGAVTLTVAAYQTLTR